MPCGIARNGRIGAAVVMSLQLVDTSPGHATPRGTPVDPTRSGGTSAGRATPPESSGPLREGAGDSDYHSAVPILRPFRALRYAHAPASDLSALLCPPYDIIGPDRLERLLARDAHNAVRLELPQPDPGGEPETRYRAAARTLAEWRSSGVLVKDRVPTITIHEMRFSGPDGRERRARGVFARLRLEPFSRDGVRRHERTMTGPKEDRFALLKATGANLSPVVLVHEAEAAAVRRLLDALTDGTPDAHATTDDGVSHRVWIRPASAPHDPHEAAGAVAAGIADADALLALVGSGPLTIADGHHRYETALRYRDERGRNRACESDPAWDHVLALMYHVDDAPPVLPTHRVVLSGPTGESLVSALADLFDVERLGGAREVLARMATPAAPADPAATGSGRVGLVSGPVAAILTARDHAFAGSLDPAASVASQGLDVNRVAIALARLGIDAEALAAGDRVRYVKGAAEAVALAVDGGAAAALLLDGPPVTAVTRVAAADEVMPQKSTYFDPKAPTGLLFGPLEW